MMVTDKQKIEVVDPETGEIVIQESIVPIWMIDAHDELMRKRFISGTPHEYRVKNSLELGGNSKLYADTTLLLENQEKSASMANALFQAKFKNIVRNEKAISSKFNKIKTKDYKPYPTDDHSIAGKRVRFLTIVHSVSALNKDAAMVDVRALIKEFNKCVNKTTGISCYAVVEVEVISYRNMKASKEYELNQVAKVEPIFDQYKETERRKLINYGILGSHLGDDILNGEQGQLCIHLHGLVVGKNRTILNNFLKILESNKNWKDGSRRIQMKKLSKQYLNVNKSVSFSLEHISRYIFKGGCILNEGKPYLYYKVNPRDDILTTYEESIDFESLYDEFDGCDLANSVYSKNKITTDLLSLSRIEINVLTQVNDAMMNLDCKKTGHIIKIGHWSSI